MASEQPAAPVRKAVKEDTLLVGVIKRYFKYAGAALAVWGFGYQGFSPAWILLGLVVVVWKEKHTKAQARKIQISQQVARNEKEAILATVDDLPSWVFFPDVERAEWLNKMLAQMWPYIGDYVQELLMTSVQATVQKSAAAMGSFRFININLGDIPPRIGGVKVYTENVKRDEIYMDLDIMYSSDCEIEVQLKGVKAGIKDLQLHGTLRVIFKPLLGRMPLFGGLSVFFLNNPSIDFNLTSLANALDLPGLNDMLLTIIQENIANIMVLPNRIAVQMAPGLDISRLRYPQPHGVLRIHVLGAKELEKSDISVLGKGKSDPYAVIRVGAMKFKTHVINNSLAPEWNCVFETIIDERDGQFMDVEVRDEDPGSKDDKLGTVAIDLSPVAESGSVDNWLPLENVKSGKLHMKLVWLYLSKDPLELGKKSIASTKKDKNIKTEDLSSCILMVNLDSARELPMLADDSFFSSRSKKMDEPSPYVILNVGQKTEESKVCVDTSDPRFEQAFRFLVNDPNFQSLDLKVMDKKTDRPLGEVTLPLKNLLAAPEMVQDQYFNLKRSDANSQVQMRVALRVLTEDRTNWDNASENLMTEVNPAAKETDVDATASSTAAGKSPGGDATAAKQASPAPSSPATGVEDIKKETAGKVSAAPAPVQQVPAAKQDERKGSVRNRMSSSSSSHGNLGEFRLGKIQVTLRYSMQRGMLILVVHKCVCLLACDKDNFSDPYVKVCLRPDKSTKKKTKIINNNLNPVYDETFEYLVSPQELKCRTLELKVKNDTSMFSSSKKFLGYVDVDLSQMDTSKASTEWHDLRPEDMQKETDI